MKCARSRTQLCTAILRSTTPSSVVSAAPLPACSTATPLPAPPPPSPVHGTSLPPLATKKPATNVTAPTLAVASWTLSASGTPTPPPASTTSAPSSTTKTLVRTQIANGSPGTLLKSALRRNVCTPTCDNAVTILAATSTTTLVSPSTLNA